MVIPRKSSESIEMVDSNSNYKQWRRVILIAGHPRGGTTWVGKTLGSAKNAFYVNEPLTYRFHKTTGCESELSTYFSSSKWRFGGKDRALEELDTAFLTHMNYLTDECEAPGSKVLVVKVPETEAIEFFVRQLNPNVVIYIRRNPIAILNSYHKAWLYRGWHVADNWRKMLLDTDSDVKELCLRLDAEKWKGERERILGMAVLRYALIKRLLICNLHILDYEVLAADPLGEFKKLFKLTELEWDEPVLNIVRGYLEGCTEEKGFDSVRKNSVARVNGYVRELPFWHVTHGIRFLNGLKEWQFQTVVTMPQLLFSDIMCGLWSWFSRSVWRFYILARAFLGKIRNSMSSMAF